MMRPIKLAGSQLMLGDGCLEFLKDVGAKRAAIVVGGGSMKRSGILDKVIGYLEESGAVTTVFDGVEADPSFKTAIRGAKFMLEFEPDLIIGLGGGSAMDAAKAMWIYYEHPEMTTLEELLNAKPFPTLRNKARFCCIPSTAGTASEVSRSIVITGDDGLKHGLGNMEMMPDIAICDPQVTLSMPAHITAETGMDAMTHALEALVSTRAHYVSDVLAKQAVKDIYDYLPIAYENGKDIHAREMMLNASNLAGMAFTNVSLGIVHSIAQTLGGVYHISHGLADAVILPYIVEYNYSDSRSKERYDEMAVALGKDDLAEVIFDLNDKLGIPKALKEVIQDREDYYSRLDQMAEIALKDGCTKTAPIIPSVDEMKKLFILVFEGK